MSIMYLTPRCVVEYIQQHKLYQGRYNGELGAGWSSNNNSSTSLAAASKAVMNVADGPHNDDQEDDAAGSDLELMPVDD